MPIYSMSTIKLPKSLYEEVDSSIRKLWWKGNNSSKNTHNYFNLMNLDVICRLELEEGLGFHKIEDFNKVSVI